MRSLVSFVRSFVQSVVRYRYEIAWFLSCDFRCCDVFGLFVDGVITVAIAYRLKIDHNRIGWTFLVHLKFRHFVSWNAFDNTVHNFVQSWRKVKILLSLNTMFGTNNHRDSHSIITLPPICVFTHRRIHHCRTFDGECRNGTKRSARCDKCQGTFIALCALIKFGNFGMRILSKDRLWLMSIETY